MDLRYRVEKNEEFGKRQKCRKCSVKFVPGGLRLSVRVQSFKRDGRDEVWYHFDCFFALQRPSSINEIENYENLPIDDQQKIRKKITNLQLPLIPLNGNVNPKLKRAAPVVESKIVLSDFNIEYSVSSRAECVGCRNKIMKGLIRVGKNEFFTEIGMKFGGQKFQHHLECFGTICRKEYGFYLGFDQLPGFSQLTENDQLKVMTIWKSTNIEQNDDGASDEKKIKLEAGPSNYDQDLENVIKIQTEKFQTVRELLKKHCKAKTLSEFLTQNGSDVVQGYDNILDRCADFISFGAIPKCTKCLNGNMIFSKNGYKCDGTLNEWANCDRFESSLQRQAVKFPKSMNSFADQLLTSSRIKLVVQNRAVRPIVEPNCSDSKRDVKVARKREPLYNMHIVAIGQFSVQRPQLKQKIESFGGKLVSTLQQKIAFVISTEDEVVKLNKRMQQVQSFHIQVVDESFLDQVVGLSPDEVIERIKSSEISDWGNDPMSRIPQEDKSIFMESVFTRYAKKVDNVKIKNGSAIDPDSGLSDEAHVYQRDDILYTSVLGFVDIQRNKNSFYKIQVLQSDNLKRFWVFSSWGRIGTKLGDKKLEPVPSAEMAVTEFERIYLNKTGNLFDPNVDFRKVSGRYYPIDVDYEDDMKKFNLSDYSSIPSKLPGSVQQLVKMIFDVDSMKQAMLEFKLDLQRMPLGRLSKNQLSDANKTLSDLNDLIANGAADSEFIGLSNKFFTLVPHNLGMRSAPIINTVDLINEKREMIDSLLQIEIAYSLLQEEVEENANPIDARYDQMKTELKPLDRNSMEFKLIQQYVSNTHAPTHTEYNLIVEDIFEVKREGEEVRYRPFKSLHNRQLLWHGSRLTNFAGIFSNGLKIAPKEAPATGYMFGKGIYFADMVSKSANYCFATPNNPTGLMLLSEVALGNTYNLTEATYINQLRGKFHSVRGLGKTFPNPNMTITTSDGVAIPIGTPITNDALQHRLLYNEYIVYDVSQVNLKYLLKIKFDFK